MSLLIFQRIKTLFFLAIFFCSLTSFSVWCVQEERSNLGFKVNYVAPSCHITVPAEVDLGSLPLNTRQHSSFTLSVNCPVQRNFSLYASVVGHSTNTWSGYVLMDRGDGGPVWGVDNQRLSPSLYLDTLDGEKIYLEGQLNQNFCNNKVVCEIIPTTYVSSDNVAGTFSTSIRFTVIYH